MRSRLLLNLLLLAVAGALLAMAFLEPGGGPASREAPAPLSTLDRESIRALRITPPDHPPFALERGPDGQWRIVTPRNLPADGFRVEALLGVLRVESERRLSVPLEELAPFGLSPPRARLEIDGAVFDFGDTEPLSGRRYLRHGDEVHLIPDGWFHHLAADHHGFVHPAPLGPDPEPRRIDLPGESLRFVDERWHREPPDPAASADELAERVSRWRHARAVAVRPYAEERAWEDGEVRVALEGEESPRRFRVARGLHEVVLGDAGLGLQYHFPRRREAAHKQIC